MVKIRLIGLHVCRYLPLKFSHTIFDKDGAISLSQTGCRSPLDPVTHYFVLALQRMGVKVLLSGFRLYSSMKDDLFP